MSAEKLIQNTLDTNVSQSMKDILEKEIIYFIYFLGKFTKKREFNSFILCEIVTAYLIKERMISRTDVRGKCVRTLTYWVSGNFQVLHSYNDLPAITYSDGYDEWDINRPYKNSNEQVVDYTSGDEVWYKYGSIHRDNDLPAVVRIDGFKCWYKNGKLHRDNDLPSVFRKNGSKLWHQNGKLHRDNDLPAVTVPYNCTAPYTAPYNYKAWYINGQICRHNDEPAVICGGTLKWYKNGTCIKMVEEPDVFCARTLKWYKN